MLLVIKKVLNAQQLLVVQKLLENAQFVDGKLSAGKEAKAVKNNEELDAQSPLHQQLNQMVMNSLVQNQEYQQAAFPSRVSTPFYARYTQGMTYGFHVDNPVMGPYGQQYRTDVSTTVFLNDKDAYQGGELVIHTAFGEQKIKLEAGDAIVYPSSSLHKINEITEGKRLVAVIWAQSMIRDPAKRELLYELSGAREVLLEKQPEADETRHVSNVYSNLVRRWSDV